MIFRKKKFALQEKVTIVSGLPRSGTSLMMKMLEAGGLPPLTDGERQADSDNPKGYYEFERVKKLPDGDIFWLPDAKGKAVKVIAALLPHLPNEFDYQVLFMRRAMPEILASQYKMLENRGEDTDAVSDADIAALFEKHLADTLAWAKAMKNVQLLQVDYNQIMSAPEDMLGQIDKFFQGSLDIQAMRPVIDPALYRQRKAV